MENIIVYGPTASGKSDFAIDLALKKNGAIINCDSQQIYREIPIITAQPSSSDMKKVKHMLYGIVDYNEDYNVNRWLEDVAYAIEEVNNTSRVAIIVGGTGLYINALLHGVHSMSDVSDTRKRELYQEFATKEVADLYDELRELDSEYAKQLSANDRQRISRALVFCQETGKRYSDFRDSENTLPKVLEKMKWQKIYLKPDRESLYEKINKRFIDMTENGAIDEVKSLYEKLGDNQDYTKATGVKEMVSYLKGELTKDEMIERSQQLTRNYAKRQYTWFNRQLEADQLIAS